MFSRKYWDKEKVKEFPEIKDWTSPQNHLRFDNDVNGMKWKYWYWFHPSAYKLMFYGSPVLSLALLLALMIYALSKESFIVAFLVGIGFFSIGQVLFKRIKMYPFIKYLNHYDIYLREEEN
jgi:hypothetical protein